MSIGYFSIVHHRLARMASAGLLVVLVAAIAMTGVKMAHAAPGDLDLGFGSGGIAPAAGTFHAVAIQPDGKIVAAGYVGGMSDRDFVVARYNSDGTLDTSFSDDGIVTTDTGPNDGAWAVTLQQDGKIVAAGYSGFLSGSSDFVLIRYHINGTLDTTFAGDGIAVTDIGLSTMDLAYSVTVQPDGKIVAAGHSGTTGTGGDHADAALVRYNTDGMLDISFGTNGIVRTDAASVSNDIVAMVIQPDGKIVAAGQRNAGGPGVDGQFILYRYTSEGSLDISFDGDGVVVTDFGPDSDVAHAMTLQPDGRIIAAGPSYKTNYQDNGIALARYNANGSLDTTFDSDGKVLTVTGQANPLSAVAFQNDGKLIAVGDEWLLRYNANGSLDTSFSEDGIVLMNGELGYDTAIQDDGKVVVVGTVVARYLSTDPPLAPSTLGTSISDRTQVDLSWADNSTDETGFRIERSPNGTTGWVEIGTAAVNATSYQDIGLACGLTYYYRVRAYRSGDGLYSDYSNVANATTGTCQDGDLDPSFGSGGIVITHVGTGYNSVNDVVIQPDGKIIAIGGGGIGIAMARYDPNGTLDTTFSEDGVITTGAPPSSSTYALAGALQSDGKIVVAGCIAFAYELCDFLVARYNPNGALDTSFGSSGMVSTDLGSPSTALSVAVQADGKIVVGGYRFVSDVPNNDDAALARYNPDGSLDTSFGSSGIVITDAPTGNAIVDMRIQPDGKIVAVGAIDTDGRLDSTTSKSLLHRYNPDGSLDTTFGTNGVVITDFSSNGDALYATAIQSDGKIIAAGYSYNGSGGANDLDFMLARYHEDGSLDTSFGPSGSVTTNIGAGEDVAADVLIQNNGKIVSVGCSECSAPSSEIVIVRHTADGALDTSFAGDGILHSNIQAFSSFGSAALSSNGIVAAGSSNNDFALARYLADDPPVGPTSLTASISNRTQIDLSWTDNSSDETGFRIERSPNGTTGWVEIGTAAANATSYQDIGLACGSTYYYRVRAYRSSDGLYSDYSNAANATTGTCQDGDLDPTFGSGGVIITNADTGAEYEEFYATAIQPDGKIVAAGAIIQEYYSGSSFAVARYNPNGTLDTSFAGDGISTTNISAYDVAWAVAIQRDGKIVAAGYSGFLGVSSDFLVIRYNMDGTLDTSFSGDGIIVTDVGTPYDAAWAVAIQQDGKIVASGGDYDGAALARYNADGTPDISFGINGIVHTDIDSVYNIVDMDIQPDGKIVAAGQRVFGEPEAGLQFVVYRYNSDGSLDTTFDGDGIAITDFGLEYSELWAMALQPDGRIVAAGYTYNSGDSDSDFALVRYNTDGSLDVSFGTNGKVITDIQARDELRDIVLQNNGKLVAVGRSEEASSPWDTDFVLVRYDADGSLDSSFSGDGIVITPVGISDDHIFAAASQSDGKIVVAGYSITLNVGGDFALARYLTTDSLPTPTLLAPANGSATDDGTPTFEWGDVTGATQYQIQVDNNAGFTSPEVDATTAASTFTPASALANGAYSWRVRASNGGWGAYSSAWAVTIDAVQPLPVGLHQEMDSRVIYSGMWSSYNGSEPSGGSIKYSGQQGATISFEFSGTGLNLYRTLAANRGPMQVCIDTSCQTVQNYSATLQWNRMASIASGLANTTHPVTITNMTAGVIDLDAIEVLGPPVPLGPGSYEETNGAFSYSGSWTSYSGSGPSGGSIKYTGQQGAAVSFLVSGANKLTVYRTLNSSRGPMQVCVDAACQTVQNYNATLLWNQPAVITGFSTGQHAVTITNTTTSLIDLDAVTLELAETDPPSNPTGLSSSSHTVSVTSTDNTIDMTWSSDASDGTGSGVAGYSVVFDNSASTTPDTTVDVAANVYTRTSTALADGTWYFHLRTCDNAGNCAAALHIGPYPIDATTPLPIGLHQETDSRVGYSGTWSSYNGNEPSGGSIKYSGQQGATISFEFSGTGLNLYRTLAANRGPMQVCIDTSCQTVQNYSATLQWNRMASIASGLADTTHPVTITNTTAGVIDLDAIEVLGPPVPLGPGSYEETNGAFSYSGSWTSYSGSGPSGGSIKYTGQQNASISFSFTGTGLRLYRTLNSNRGPMQVCVDSVCQTVQNTSISLLWNQMVNIASGLANTTHQVTVSNLSISIIDLDAVEVLGPAALLGGGFYKTERWLISGGMWNSYVEAVRAIARASIPLSWKTV